MTVRIKFEPRDLWVGAYIEDRHRVYLCIVPTLPIVLEASE